MSTRPDLDAVLPLLDRYAEQLIATDHGPSYALAITDRDGLLAVRTWGTLTPDSSEVPTAETLYEIGSIGKSFTAIVLLQLAAEGLVDLHAPVADQLPLWRIPSSFEPVTPHHLMTHTSGLSCGSDHVPAPELELWMAQGVPLPQAPNTSFIYSNLGYKTLGLLIEHATGESYGDNIRRRIFEPLGMVDAEPIITNAIRQRMAPGHGPFYDDRPAIARHGLVPATWLETNTGDGCLAMSAPALAMYLRALLNRGAGLLDETQFATFLDPHPGETPEPTYGYGIEHELTDEGVDRVGHDGGMVGWVSDMTGDLATGLGVVVLNNGVGWVGSLASFAMKALLASARGEPVPEVPPARDETVIANASDYVGHYAGSFPIEIVPHGESIAIVRDGGEPVPLLHPGDGDAFVLDAPGDDLFAFVFRRDEESQVTGITHGSNWFVNERDTESREVVAPPEWAAYEGHYRSYNPWFGELRVVARRGALYAVSAGQHEVELRPDGDRFIAVDHRSPGQPVRFEPVVGGRALALRFDDGAVLTRVFTA